MEHPILTSTATSERIAKIPEWMIDLHQFRKELFLRWIEPIILYAVGPMDPDIPTSNTFPYLTTPSASVESTHRRLGFLPNYVEDASAFRETSMSFATLSVTFVIMSCLLGIFLSCFYHNQKTAPLFASPRRHRLPKLVPPPLPVEGMFSWLKVVFFMSDEEIINRIGYDSLIFLRFHRLALRCIVKMSVFSFLVLLPLNFTGSGHANASDLKGYVGTLLFTDFLRFTMANVSGGSPRLWVHCFAAYLLTLIVCRELLVEYNAFNHVRHRYLLSKESHLRTVLVSNIPRHLRSAKKITTYFRHVYPEAVKSVWICQNLINLEKLVAERNTYLAKIEKELLVLCRNEKRKLVGHTMAKVKYLCSCWNMMERLFCFDGSQERLTKLYSKLEEFNDKVEKEQLRRQRIMKRLDNMEAGEGSKDIDYILASPFIGNPEHLRTFGRFTIPDMHDRVLPPSIGAPRNPDGSFRTFPDQAATSMNSIPEIPPNANQPEPFSETGDPATSGHPQYVPPLYDEQDVLPQEPTGPQLRKSKILAPSDTLNPSLEDASEKQPRARQPFSKARHAILRYSHVARATSFLGRPIIKDKLTTQKKSYNDHIEDHTNEVCDKAFVVMRTFTASTIAIQSMHSSKPGSMQVTTAPEPRDILWDNIYVSKGAKRMRTYIGETIVLLMITFYVVPVALMSLLVSESALISSSPRLAQLDQASALFSSAIAMVQPFCLVGIQQLLPPLFIVVGKAEGLVSFSEVQMRAFSRYFMFQVLNVFLVTAITGSVFDTIAIIIENPEATFEMLGNSLPRMSSFFITYVIMKTFLGLGMELVRTMSLVQAMLLRLIFPVSTLREHRSVRLGMRAIDDPGWFPFHKILAQDMLVVVISVVFAVVAPLVLLPCALFCLFSRVMWTHHHLYVYESVFETGGQFWPKIFRRFVFGLITAQATITGQFILKEARHEAYGTIVLMFLTYFFLRSTRARYDAASHTLPLEVATVMDISVSQEEEARRKYQERRDGVVNDSAESSTMYSRDISPGQDPGAVIANQDPFEHAYLQPAIRAKPRARPEQPFPPAQIGRDEIFGKANGSSTGSHITEEDLMDTSATVRLKSLNREDRKMMDRWWNEQVDRAGKQNLFSILIGEESGTLQLIDRHAIDSSGMA